MPVSAPAAPTPAPKPSGPVDQRIAVVGIGVHYAGAASLDEFWKLLNENRSGCDSVKAKRLSVGAISNHLNEQGKLMGADAIANDSYGALTGVETEHDLLLGLVKNALADAGSPDVSRRCGIVSGCLSFPRDGFQQVLNDVYKQHTEGQLGGTASMSAGKGKLPIATQPELGETELARHAEHTQIDPASYAARKAGLDEASPRLCLDAACASALYCMKLAQDYLATGRADMMLCGASCFPEPMFVLSGFSAFQALPHKNSGKPSVPFQRDTAGLTPGEGGAMFVLKRLADAERDGDRIYGTLLGAHVSNAGCGLPLKPHMESELECMRDTYGKFGVEPSTLQYLECHATGTPQGDMCELQAIRGIFGQNSMPLLGSTKGNFGHSLVAAGFAGCAKLLLSMAYGHIPPSPKITKAMDANVCAKSTPWPAVKGPHPKRGGVSAFGFGGTNAHAVFEQYVGKSAASAAGLRQIGDGSPTPLAIVGMAAQFGTLKSLREFEAAIYAGADGACELPPKRWRFLQHDEQFREALHVPNTQVEGSQVESSVRGCFIEDVMVDHGRLRLPMLPEDQLQPQQLIALTTIDKALQDANLNFDNGAKVAVLVGLGTDMELYRHRARVALRERLGLLPSDTLTAEQSTLLAYVSDISTATSYTSNIGNIIATRIASLWGFTGPAFSVTQGANSVFRALDLASMMMASGEIDAAVVAGVDLGGSAEALFARRLHKMFSEPGAAERLGAKPAACFEADASPYCVGEGAGAIVLKRRADCVPGRERVYASIDALAEAATVEASAAYAMAEAKVTPGQVGYVELAADGSSAVDDNEVRGVARAYTPTMDETSGAQKPAPATAVGTAKSNVGHTGYASGAAALIKAALCLHHRYLPATKGWRAPKAHMKSAWEGSSLYVCDKSRAWVANEAGSRRAAVSGVSSSTDSKFHVILSDTAQCYEEGNVASLDPAAPKLLVLGADSAEKVIVQVRAALERITAAGSTSEGAEDEFARLLLATVAAEKGTAPKFALCLVCAATTLKKELELAASGVATAAATGRDYASVAGSCFSPMPRRSGQVAFMYGDGSSPYIGLGRDLHRLVPQVHEFVQRCTTAMWSAKHDTWNARGVVAEQMEADSAAFEKRTVDMFRSGVYHSVCFTHVARELLGLSPAHAFGLSLGEAAAYFAFDEANSKQSDAVLHNLDTSPVWTEALSEKFTALRAAWGLPADAHVSSFWVGHAVQASRAEVEAALSALGPQADCVRLLIVNDSKTCIVAGKPEQCAALISKLGVPAFPIEQGMAGHCQEVAPYVDEIARIHSMLRVPQGGAATGVTFYTSSVPGGGVAQMPADGRNAGALVASVYRNTADFPALVGAAAARGADVFVELGAGDLRAAATKDILGKQGVPHVAVAFDKRGAEPWRQLLKMAATLITHGGTGCKVSGLYHPTLLAELDAKVHGPLEPKAKKAARRKIVINGRFRGMEISGAKAAVDANAPATPDSRLLSQLKRIPTSLMDLSTMSSNPGSNTSLSELGSR